MAIKNTLDSVAKLIDDLAITTNNGFDRVEKRLDEHDARFDAIDQQFIFQRHYMDTRFDQLETRLDRIEKHLKLHRDMLDSYGTRIARIEKHIGLKSQG